MKTIAKVIVVLFCLVCLILMGSESATTGGPTWVNFASIGGFYLGYRGMKRLGMLDDE